MNSSNRYEFLDILRGITLISMILYHSIWNIANIFSNTSAWFSSDIFYIWQQSICQCFILLSGFCYCLGKKHIKRGVTVFLCGMIVTAVTLIFMPENAIIFGILTFLGSAMLISAVLERFLKKINPLFGIIFFIFLFIATKSINSGYILFFKLPKFLYRGYIATFLGFCDPTFRSADYFSVFPWIFLYFSGFSLFGFMKKKNKLDMLKTRKIPLLSFMGRHSLEIYMLHQPIIFLILYLILGR